MAFSDELGRGTEILYSGWGLKQPKDLKKQQKNKCYHNNT